MLFVSPQWNNISNCIQDKWVTSWELKAFFIVHGYVSIAHPHFIKCCFIPFDFSTHFLEALRSCYFVLEHGKGLCFFPEGLRSTDGKIGEFKKGFGILAKVTGAMLLPVAITGAHEAWPSTAKYPKRHPINIKFGKPLLPGDLEKEGISMGAQDPYEAICLAARKALVELKNS